MAVKLTFNFGCGSLALEHNAPLWNDPVGPNQRDYFFNCLRANNSTHMYVCKDVFADTWLTENNGLVLIDQPVVLLRCC